MGPDANAGDKPRNTTDYTLPSFHVRQTISTFGCDAQVVNDLKNVNDIYNGRGAWRYILAREGRTDGTGVPATVNETEGIYAFDYEGLENYFTIHDNIDPFTKGQTYSDLAATVTDFVLYRVRGGERPGTCYYECEYGYEDCDGDPRNGCEVAISACVDGNGLIGWDYTNGVPTDGCEIALGYSKAQLQATGTGPFTFSCVGLAAKAKQVNINNTLPIYCRGGQDGNLNDLGTCQFTCNAGFQDCDGNPGNGCEVQISDDHCDCISCSHFLGGTLSKSTDQTSSDWFVSQSTCQPNNTCSLPCDNTLCVDKDNDWTNGCETAVAYLTPRNSTAIPSWNCAIWAQVPLIAKKHHIDPNLLPEIFCEGRQGASNAGTCTFQGACLKIAAGAINNYQDCDNDPRNGCEDPDRWCQVGKADGTYPRGTPSDRCSSALRYMCTNGFNSNNQLCEAILAVNDVPYDCEDLFRTAADLTASNVDNSTVPYCDRDATHLHTRGDCVFKCKTGFANCDNDARTGCEANVSLLNTCNYDCIDCQTLPGIDPAQPRGCINDTLNPGQYKCQFTCINGGQSSSCADRDGKWQNGCETALNLDNDLLGIFVNPDLPMDCSVMHEEGKKNPELFVHHLHIDLTVPIPVPAGLIPLPAGSIFCNGLIPTTTTPLGACYFMCVPGFTNKDRYSYNGCEYRNDEASNPNPPNLNPDPNSQSSIPFGKPVSKTIFPYTPSAGSPNPTYPFRFGGYRIGNYNSEKLLFTYYSLFLGVLGGKSSPIVLPIHIELMQLGVSNLYNPIIQPILWY